MAHHSKSDGDTCTPSHDAVTLGLSIFLCVGLFISYLPQIIRIIIKKSSLGFSPWFLLLGATSSASVFLNVVTLQWATVRCCAKLTAGQCLESLLGIFQVGLQWLLFNFCLALFLYYYPVDHRYERAIALPKRTRAGGNEDEELQDESDDDSSIGDIDSLGSHIANNYSSFDPNASGAALSSGAGTGTPGQSNWTAGSSSLTPYEDSPDASGVASRFAGIEENAPASSSAFDRLVPSFWPVWKAPARKNPGPSRLGPGVLPAAGAHTEVGLPPSTGEALPPNATTAAKSAAAADADPSGPTEGTRCSRQALLGVPRALRKRRRVKHKTPEWSLAQALAWVVVLHFIFILLVTILLVSTLPATAFPPPNETPLPIPPGTPSAIAGGMLHLLSASSSRLLISRWAAFLGITGTLLATAQYVPQIVHTFHQKHVGSLSIPTMLLQVPGTVIFVYSLAIRPGIDWTSLAAYVCTGVLQLVLLIMCLCWKVRQNRLGLDDYGRPVNAQAGTEDDDGVVRSGEEL